MTLDLPPARTGSQRHFWTKAGYGLMVVGAIFVFLLIRSYGETLEAPTDVAVTPPAGHPEQSPDTLLRLLTALTAVIVVGQILAKVFAYISQPPVIGEVVAGILLGPSLLGAEWSAQILPPSVAPVLGGVAQLGVILYMFLVGLELNAGLLKQRAHAVVAISHASILAPFLLGALLALALYPRLSHRGVPFTSFALFLGVAMAITAFPVLARILTDRRMTHSELGVIAMSCAAADDATAWCLLAFVVAVAKAKIGQGLLVFAGALAYSGFMLFIARPHVARWAGQWEAERPSRGVTGLVFVALLLSALATEAVGIHALFGAFLLGAIIPHDSALAKSLTSSLEQIVTTLFLPAFFALTGMRTRIDLVSTPTEWLMCGVIIAAATLGKFGGTLVAARLTSLTWRDSAILGALMNTRGLMELIVLSIGLELGVISPTLFSMMVLMALATTMSTAPALRVLMPRTQDKGAAGGHVELNSFR